MHRASLILFFYAGGALAHPDHGAGSRVSAALSHLLSEPDHLAIILAPLVVGILLVGRRAIKSRIKRDRV
jgi:hydrogenase/urease accessory protein HupE